MGTDVAGDVPRRAQQGRGGAGSRLRRQRALGPDGKVAGLPLYVLWGGARNKLPIIAIGGQYGENFTPAHYGREMEEYRALGLAGCKFKIGGESPPRMRRAPRRRVRQAALTLYYVSTPTRLAALDRARVCPTRAGPQPALVRGALPLDQ